MDESKIFTVAELKALEKRMKGSKEDKTGIYSARVKPKIKELIEWFKIKNKLKKLL